MIQLSKDFNTKKERAILLSVFSNTLLVIGKTIVGILTGSVSILSEAIHSVTDLLASGIVWWSVRQSAKPPDKEHAYGYGKVETIAAFCESLLIISAAGWIVWEAVQKLFYPEPIGDLYWGLGVMGFSVLINSYVSYQLFKVGKETDSQALVADAQNLATDIWGGVGVFLGLGLIYLTGWYWVDSVIAIMIGLWILRMGVKLLINGFKDLADSSLPEADNKKIREILNSDPRIITYHHLRSRKSGPICMIDLRAHLDRHLSLEEAHQIADEIEDKIREVLPNVDIVIHTEPCDENENLSCKLIDKDNDQI